MSLGSERPVSPRPAVVLVGRDWGEQGPPKGSGDRFRWIEIEEAAALASAPRGEIAAVVTAFDIGPQDAAALAGELAGAELIVLDRDPRRSERVVEPGLAFYVCRGLPAEPLSELAEAVARRSQRRRARLGAGGRIEAERLSELLRWTAALEIEAEADAVLAYLGRAICRVVGADRGRCLLYDESEGRFRGDGTGPDAAPRVLCGVTGFVARTATPLAVERAGATPLYEAWADDPQGDDRARLAAVPALLTDGEVVGVMIAARDARAPGFGQADLTALRRLAELTAGGLARRVLAERLEAESREVTSSLRDDEIDVFRREALEHYLSPGLEVAGPVQSGGGWTRWVAWLLGGLVATAVVVGAGVEVNQVVAGRAIIVEWPTPVAESSGRSSESPRRFGVVAALSPDCPAGLSPGGALHFRAGEAELTLPITAVDRQPPHPAAGRLAERLPEEDVRFVSASLPAPGAAEGVIGDRGPVAGVEGRAFVVCGQQRLASFVLPGGDAIWGAADD